jgi:DNA phosphorothioation-associated putative methyltransferase
MSETEAFADGYVTSRGTFQKLFEQHELKTWIDQALETAVVPAGPGVFYAFHDPGERAAFVASRYRREIVVPRLTRSIDRFEIYKALLQPLMDFFAARGRLPDLDELPETAAVITALGSLKRAFRVIQSATGAEAWAEIAAKRAQDLLIYLALARFDRRPTLTHLPLPLQRDIKALFPSYAQACKQADDLLFSVGRTGEVNAACSSSLIGKKDARSPLCTPQRHRSAASKPTCIRGLRARLYRSRRRRQSRQTQPARAEDLLPDLSQF